VKQWLKLLADFAAMIVVAPAVACYYGAAAVVGPVRAFPGWSQAFALAPGTLGAYLRRAFYRVVLARCDAGACITFGTIFSHPTASVGRNVYIGAFCCLGDVTLEDDVLLGSHVSVANGAAQHGIERLDVPIREQPGIWPRVTIGRDTWVGDRATVLADVGQHCVIGAGAVVTESVPDYAVAVGVPARVVRYRRQCDESSDLSAGL
jgi:virginiamycin A acetyltransferase